MWIILGELFILTTILISFYVIWTKIFENSFMSKDQFQNVNNLFYNIWNGDPRYELSSWKQVYSILKRLEYPVKTLMYVHQKIKKCNTNNATLSDKMMISEDGDLVHIEKEVDPKQNSKSNLL